METEFIFKVGMIFANEEEAYKAYNAYAFNKGFEIRKGKKTYNRKNELRGCIFLCCCEDSQNLPPQMIEKLKDR